MGRCGFARGGWFGVVDLVGLGLGFSNRYGKPTSTNADLIISGHGQVVDEQMLCSDKAIRRKEVLDECETRRCGRNKLPDLAVDSQGAQNAAGITEDGFDPAWWQA